MFTRSFSEYATSRVSRYVVLESCHEVHANRMAFQELRALDVLRIVDFGLFSSITSFAGCLVE
jgi:hypothetical protein